MVTRSGGKVHASHVQGRPRCSRLCLNGDMGDWQAWLRSGHRRSASMARGRLGTSASDLRRASGHAAQKPGSSDPVLSAVRPRVSRRGGAGGRGAHGGSIRAVRRGRLNLKWGK